MGRRIRYSRPKIAPTETLLDFLCARFPYLSREAWELHITAGHLSVVGSSGESSVASASYVLRQNDELHFNPPRELEPDVDESISIVHEDKSLIVCVKNGNLPVAEGGRYSSNTLMGVLHRRSESFLSDEFTSKGKRGRCSSEEVSSAALIYYPVHRLDKETSGLVVLAKEAAAARILSMQFEQQSNILLASLLRRQALSLGEKLTPDAFEELFVEVKVVTKSYIAVLAGIAPVNAVFVVCDRIGLLSEALVEGAEGASDHEKLKRLKMACFPDDAENNHRGSGRAACSRVRILANNTELGVSVASVDILTGRTHQIRLHCAQLGFPVLGDKLYATKTPGVKGGSCAVSDNIYLARVKDKMGMISSLSPRLCVKRHLLHATLFSFCHPVTGERISFFSNPSKWFLRDVVEEEIEASDRDCPIEALRKLLEQAIKVLRGTHALFFGTTSLVESNTV